MFKKTIVFLLAFALSTTLIFVTGCESDAQSGALIGGAVGAGAGQAIGRDTKSTLIGTGIGVAAGYIIGNERDKKKRQQQPVIQNEVESSTTSP